MKSPGPHVWLIIMVVALLLLVGLALPIQRPDLLKSIPFFAPTPTPTPIASENIIITAPSKNVQVGLAFDVIGKARTMENVVSIRVRDQLSGRVYVNGTTITDAQRPGTFGDFSTTVQIPDSTIRSGDKLLLEVFQVAPKDGRELDRITIPITFSPYGG